MVVLVALFQIGAALTTALGGARPPELRADEWLAVSRIYERASSPSAPAPLWVDGGRLAPRASELHGVLASVDTFGLRPADYPLGALTLALREASAHQAAPPAALARADVLLTASFVALVDDLLTGRVDPRKVEPTWHVAPRAFDVVARVRSALDEVRAGRPLRDVIRTLRPAYGVYEPLLGSLARYRAIARGGDWPLLPPGPALRVGAASPDVIVLRRRLAAEGYSVSTEGDSTFDAVLGTMVAEFQRRHGLVMDGVVGPATRRALNVPASERVRRIEANLERLRWLPPDLGERFIVVNVPSFTLVAYDDLARTLTMRVVVGDEMVSRRTPIFADTMEYIEFGPYWNVPRSIAVREILPRARSDRDYLRRNHYQIVRGWGDNAPVVDPTTLTSEQLFSTGYRVRQLPGPWNALGRVKFIFPNDYSVYLHDTPAQALFEDVHRAHSHGCVRVSDPEGLAAFVLHDRADWPRDRIAAAMASGQRVRVNLRRGPPVFLLYLTAFVRDDIVMFRDDIYDRDAGLLRALAKGGRGAAIH